MQGGNMQFRVILGIQVLITYKLRSISKSLVWLAKECVDTPLDYTNITNTIYPFINLYLNLTKS